MDTSLDPVIAVAAADVSRRVLEIVESCADGIVYVSVDGTALMVNPAAALMFGCSQEDAIGRPMSSFCPSWEWQEQLDVLAQVTAGQPVVGLEADGLRADGSEFPMSVTVSPIKDGDDDVVAVVATVRDLSVPPTRVREIRAAGSPHVTLAAFSKEQAALDACVVVVDTTVVYASPRGLVMTGARSSTDVVGHDMFEFVAPVSIEATVARHTSTASWPRPELITILQVGGGQMTVEVSSAPVLWDGKPATQITMWEQVDAAEQVRVFATGVRSEVADAVLVTDVQFRIQSVNAGAEELYGWTEAELLGQPLSHAIPIIGDAAELKIARDTLRTEGRWHGRVTQRCRDGSLVQVLASTTHVTDAAGQWVGTVSVNRPTTADPQPTAAALPDVALGHDIRRALAADEFVLHYQPIIAMEDGRTTGVEALVRWNHPTRGLLAPSEFIEAAERLGLIGRLGEIVLDKACAQAQMWRDAGRELSVSVNLSGRQLIDSALPNMLAAVLARTGLPASLLWLEITETSLVADYSQARRQLLAMHELGVRIAIDDFGTGWASLTYLRELPVDALKIDRSFVGGLGEHTCDMAIVKSILAIGRELGLGVIAEGIETVDQRTILHELGCEKAQGYFFARPAPADVLFSDSKPDGSDAVVDEVVLDPGARDAMLVSLLDRHPAAIVSALDADARAVEFPYAIHLREHVVSVGSPLDVIAASSYTALFENWERAKRVGWFSIPVLLCNGDEAMCDVVDVRHSHGVLIGLLSVDGPLDLQATKADRPQVMPRTGRIDKDDGGIILAVDARICRMLGYEASELIGLRSLALVHPDDQRRAVEAWTEMRFNPDTGTRLRARHARKDGSWLWIELTNTNLLSQPEHCVVTEMVDISDEMSALESLRQREQLLTRLAEVLPSGVIHVDRNRHVVYENVRAHRLFGTEASTDFDAHLAEIRPDDRGVLTDALTRVIDNGGDVDLELEIGVDGSNVPRRRCAIAIRALTDTDNATVGAVLCIDDVTEAFALRAELERRATTDELTGCLNRAAILDEVTTVLRRTPAGGHGTAVVFVDLDGFKEVNDTFGHLAGDQLLARSARQLRLAMRSGDTIGRLGGDEFLVLLPNVRDVDTAMSIVSRLGHELAQPLEIVGGLPIRIRSSIGVAWSDLHTTTTDSLVAAADRAMYECKRVGRSEPVLVAI